MPTVRARAPFPLPLTCCALLELVQPRADRHVQIAGAVGQAPGLGGGGGQGSR